MIALGVLLIPLFRVSAAAHRVEHGVTSSAPNVGTRSAFNESKGSKYVGIL